MRPVSGFERPALQWLYVALGAVLVIVAVVEAARLRHLRGEIASLRASERSGRLERDEWQAREARERSAREALSLEVARLRGGAPSGAPLPTLTLSPLAARRATPPSPTVETLGRTQLFELRLPLPPNAAAGAASYTIAVRTWSGGDTIWSRGSLRSSIVDGRAMVAALITGDVFAPGAYEVSLTSVAPDGKAADVAGYEVAIRGPARH